MGFDSWIDPMWVSSWSSWKPFSNQINLKLNILETEDAYKLCAELPGMNKQDIKVQYEGDSVTLKGEKKRDCCDKGQKCHVVERNYGKFERTLRFPENANLEKLKAKYENGLLDVSIPKFENPKAKHPKAKGVEIE